MLTSILSETFFSDGKRTYNMLKFASNGMISTITNPDGTTKKAVAYIPDNKMPVDITDLLGDTIHIHNIGRIEYKCNPSGDNYIYAYRVSKHSDKEILMTPRVVFSNINVSMLDNSEYRSAVANILLSKNNIELSQVGGYIGEISLQSTLNVGEEKSEPGFYTYQVSPKYALVYDGEKIEAVQAYQKENEKTEKVVIQDDEER